MAITFGPITGDDDQDALDTGLTADPPERTWAFWSRREGDNNAGQSRYFDQGPGGELGKYQLTTVASIPADQFSVGFTGGAALWRWQRAPADVWVHLAIAYDNRSAANQPIVWLNGVRQTVTTVLPAVGTILPATGPLIIANNQLSGGVRGFRGALAEWGVWSSCLHDAQVLRLARGLSPGAAPDGLIAWMPLIREPVDLLRGLMTLGGGGQAVHPPVGFGVDGPTPAPFAGVHQPADPSRPCPPLGPLPAVIRPARSVA